MLKKIRMQKEKRMGKKLTPKPNTAPSQPVFLFFLIINHYIRVKILTVKFSSVIAFFGLTFDILTISSLKVVRLQLYSGAKITVFPCMVEEAAYFLGRVAMRLYQLLIVDKSEVANRSW